MRKGLRSAANDATLRRIQGVLLPRKTSSNVSYLRAIPASRTGCGWLKLCLEFLERSSAKGGVETLTIDNHCAKL
jgi:hypothetical protein